ncbi:hypothetical protein [Halobellus ordinarius]|uniref:hypothetical protein n=1 Tax=Halobellus ordinarius TaxID=3075120 RepID=UPI002880AD6A|nr:hypothetical protein [Halobellus sp. ZY16]
MTGHRPGNDAGARSADDSRTRRSYLAGIAAGIGLVSGCLSGADGTGGAGDEDASSEPSHDGEDASGLSADDVPEFGVDESAQPTPMLLAAAIPDAEPLAFLDTFTVELAVGNVGGATITGQTTTVAASVQSDSADSLHDSVSEPDPVAVELPDIAVGEWERVEVELRVNAGTTWTITADAREHPAFDPSFEVNPRRLAAGDTVVSDVGGFEITALESRFERALHYRTEEGGVGLLPEDATGLLSASDGHVLALHRFRVTNKSDRSLGFGQVIADNAFADAGIRTDPGATVTADAMRDSLETLVLDGGVPFGDNKIAAGESADLVAIQELRETEIPDSTLTLSLWGETEDVRFEAVDDTPPLPDFELVDATISARDGADPTIEVTVENVGDAPGTFRGGLQFYETRPTASDWVYLPEGIAVTIDPGERVTESVPATRGDERFRVTPFERKLSV